MEEIAKWLKAARNGRVDQRDVVTTGAGEIQLAAADRNRIALLIPTPTAGTWSISFGRAASQLTGFRITNGLNGILLNIRDHGALVQQEVRGYVQSAGSIAITSVIAGEE